MRRICVCLARIMDNIPIFQNKDWLTIHARKACGYSSWEPFGSWFCFFPRYETRFRISSAFADLYRRFAHFRHSNRVSFMTLLPFVLTASTARRFAPFKMWAKQTLPPVCCPKTWQPSLSPDDCTALITFLPPSLTIQHTLSSMWRFCHNCTYVKTLWDSWENG